MNLKKLLIYILMVGCTGPWLMAQNNPIFGGGNADGFTALTFLQIENNGIFGGGNAAGFNSLIVTQIENNSIFGGGNADGFNILAATQIENNPIFGGGNADGFNVLAAAQIENNPIFGGGNADGFNVLAATQIENNPIFGGGNADGFNVLAATQIENNSIFGGGNADGNTLLSFLQDDELPIELISFTAFPEEDYVVLHWETASEFNNFFFTIEKTQTTEVFEEVAKVYGAGFSNEIIAYKATDYNPYYGISYYRLKQTDLDGQFEYSDLVAVEFSIIDKWNFKIQPNPTDGERLDLSFKGSDICTDLYITLTDMTGKVLIKEKLSNNNNTNFTHSCQLDKPLASGSYILSAGCGEKKMISKLLLVQSPR